MSENQENAEERSLAASDDNDEAKSNSVNSSNVDSDSESASSSDSDSSCNSKSEIAENIEDSTNIKTIEKKDKVQSNIKNLKEADSDSSSSSSVSDNEKDELKANNDESSSSEKAESCADSKDNRSESSGSRSNSSKSSSNVSHSSEDDDDSYDPKNLKAGKKKSSVEKKQKSRKKIRKRWKSDTSEEEDEESETDDSAPKKRSHVRRAGDRKKTKQYSSEEDDSDEEKKRSLNRRATKNKISYKEESGEEETASEDLVDVDPNTQDLTEGVEAEGEEDKSETIERIVSQRVGKKGCTGGQTTIYSVEEHGDPNIGCKENDCESVETQYLIKWKGWSYIHNTWESEESLKIQKVKGMKKLENFVKREQEIRSWRKYAGPEDIDYFECQLELQNELIKSYTNIDRIISKHNKDNNTIDYYCKWESLPYAEATWEDSSLVLRKSQNKVNEFDDREAANTSPSRHCKVIKYRPKFQPIHSQPDYYAEGLILRDYQLDGLNWLIHSWCKENSVILADEMGLGKTIQTICFLRYLFQIQNLHGPFLCVVPLSTMTAWQREFELWAPDMNIVTYLGDVHSREIIREYEWFFQGTRRLKFNTILTTYEILLKDKTFLGCITWAALLVDEAHRLKNDDSLLYKSLKEFDTSHRLLITGTPLQNSLKELWALLHFIMPTKFDSWEDFEKDHENAADKGYSKLHKQLEPFILRRVKKDVEKSLPAKVEQILRVEMTTQQKQYYKWILTKNFYALRKGHKGSTSTFLNIVIELKKCCNHAALIKPLDIDIVRLSQDEALQLLLKGSGKLVLLDKLLCRLKETGHRVLIFSQMVRMLDILADYLQKRHFSFQRLDGSIKGEIRRQALDHFNAENSQDFCFLLSTRAGGLGINLATADTVIIFDSDWNPQNDLQAQARAHRIGQKNQVNIYRLVTARSVEENIVERAKQKMVLDHLVIQRMDTTGRTVLDKTGATNTTPFNKDDLSAILKFGAEELFKDELENDDDLVCDIDEILRRAETRNEEPAQTDDDLLSAFKVASFAAFDEDASSTSDEKKLLTGNENEANTEDTKDWADIIPENYRKVIEDEERNKEMEDLYLPPRRKTFNQTCKLKSRKKFAEDDSEEYDEEVSSDGEGGRSNKNQQRGRPTKKEKIPGFTDAEIRRFIKSYKKFPVPLSRVDLIANDADLQEKPLADLKKLGQMLHDRCVQFLEEQKEATEITIKNEDDIGSKKKPPSRAIYSVKFGGVSFNAKTLISCEEELNPLNDILPKNAEERLKWVLDISTRASGFDVEWNIEHDSKLLCGIYEHGMGSWETIKSDCSLGLTEKIFLNDKQKKPQAKHLQSRAEYLLKIIKKNVELKAKGLTNKKNKRGGKREKNNSASNNIYNDGNIIPSEESVNQEHDVKNGLDKLNSSSSLSGKKSSGKSFKTPRGKESAAAKATKKKKKDNKPMHFTANNEPRALDVLGDLDPNIFNECKEKMRPVKKALKALDNLDSRNLSNPVELNDMKDCLLSIGKQIDICLSEYKEPDKIKEWRSNLWYFVSKFTDLDAKRLFKLYKRAVKKIENEAVKDSSSLKSNKLKKDKTEESEKKHKKKKKKGKPDDKLDHKSPDNKSHHQRIKQKNLPNPKYLLKNSEDHQITTLTQPNNNSFDMISKRSKLENISFNKKRKQEDSGNDDCNNKEYKRSHLDDCRNRDIINNEDDRRNSRDEYYGRNAIGQRGIPTSRFQDQQDRWGSRDERYSDYKRYDKYQGNRNQPKHGSGSSYQRDRDRRPDKRRYPPAPPLSSGYVASNGGYNCGPQIPPNFLMNGAPLSGHHGSYRDNRYDWNKSLPAMLPASGRGEYPPDYRSRERRLASTHQNT